MKINLKFKRKNAIFICQIGESAFKVIKCLPANNFKEYTALEAEGIAADLDDKRLSEKLIQLFKKLGYNDDPVVISLPRSKVTCRYLKIPAQAPEEIEKIISLQASRYLPYSSEELITGYQLISTDKEGYSQVNLVIVHKDIIERYLKMLKDLKADKIMVALSSYGLASFFNYLKPQESEPVMIMEVEYQQAELAIVAQKKLIFSRYFRINSQQPLWESLFIEEVRKTQDAYLKEAAKDAPRKIMVTGAGKIYAEFAQTLAKQIDLPVEALGYAKINMRRDLLNNAMGSEYSFAGVIGMGLKNIEENLNLLPHEIKEKNKILTKKKERLSLALVIAGIILMLFVGLQKNLSNKAYYLERLKSELAKMTKEARVLEDIEKRLQFMRHRAVKKLSALDLIYELHRVMPGQIALVNLTYEEDNRIILRGQTPQLNAVFELVAELRKSPVFSELDVKVKYATQKKTNAGELVDFEIVCLKK
ncbi:MAG: hypothetical protein FJZ13_03900 [Candidatus Omnitrophica bacterium]|nr:hypothetical protein [Candidatus Omnitrophota bacterium]